MRLERKVGDLARDHGAKIVRLEHGQAALSDQLQDVANPARVTWEIIWASRLSDY